MNEHVFDFDGKRISEPTRSEETAWAQRAASKPSGVKSISDLAGIFARRDVVPIPPDPADRAERPQEAAERHATALATRLALYRVPKRFQRASYADLTPEQDIGGVVSRWWSQHAAGLIIRSETKGNGKSHAAYAVGNEVVRDPGVWTLAWSVVDFNDAIKPGGDDFAYDMAGQCELLILDDLGGERLTEWTLERLYGVINTRWSEGRRTIVTSNLTGEEVQGRYGDRIVDRLIDDSWMVDYTGLPSRRKPAPW